MPRNVPFQEPSTYIRYVGPLIGQSLNQAFDAEGKDELRFIRLNAREGPIRLPYTFPAVANQQRSTTLSFSDLRGNTNHIQQVFFGICRGAQARFYLPTDVRILKLDEGALVQTSDNDIGFLDHEDSPIENPRFNFWVAPGYNYVPSIDVKNTMNDVQPPRTIDIRVFFYLCKYTYDIIDATVEPDTYEKLRRFQIPSRHVTFGGKI